MWHCAVGVSGTVWISWPHLCASAPRPADFPGYRSVWGDDRDFERAAPPVGFALYGQEPLTFVFARRGRERSPITSEYRICFVCIACAFCVHRMRVLSRRA